MRYLLFDWAQAPEDLSDPSELTDIEFEELCKLPNGHIFDNSDDLQSAFNSEHISTATHQLRVIDNFKPVVQEALDLMQENEIGAWQSDLESTVSAIITEDFQEVHDESDLEDRDDGGIIKYNGWGEKLQSLIFKPN